MSLHRNIVVLMSVLVILFETAYSITGNISLNMTYQNWIALSPEDQQKLIEYEKNKLKQPLDAGLKTVLTNKDQEEFKRNMRYQMWAQKWKGFNYENEGIHINENLAKIIQENASNFIEFHV